MTAGGPGDHPLTDVLHWRIETYGIDADNLIRRLSELLSPRELEEWWEREIGWYCDADTAKTRASMKVFWAIERAKRNGWEL